MKKIIPGFFKTETYKRLQKELGKPPRVIITPLKEVDKKNVKLLQKLMNYMFKNNINEFTNKYYSYMRHKQKEWIKEEVYGLHKRTDLLEKAVKNLSSLCGEYSNKKYIQRNSK